MNNIRLSVCTHHLYVYIIRIAFVIARNHFLLYILLSILSLLIINNNNFINYIIFKFKIFFLTMQLSYKSIYNKNYFIMIIIYRIKYVFSPLTFSKF